MNTKQNEGARRPHITVQSSPTDSCSSRATVDEPDPESASPRSRRPGSLLIPVHPPSPLVIPERHIQESAYVRRLHEAVAAMTLPPRQPLWEDTELASALFERRRSVSSITEPQPGPERTGALARRGSLPILKHIHANSSSSPAPRAERIPFTPSSLGTSGTPASGAHGGSQLRRAVVTSPALQQQDGPDEVLQGNEPASSQTSSAEEPVLRNAQQTGAKQKTSVRVSMIDGNAQEGAGRRERRSFSRSRKARSGTFFFGDSSFRRKLFGTFGDLDEEHARDGSGDGDHKVPFYFQVLPSDHIVHVGVSIVVLLSLLWVLAGLPFAIAFGADGVGSAWLAALSALYTVDCLVRCVTNQKTMGQEKETILQPTNICHYARTWMVIDLAAAIPWWALPGSSRGVALLHALKLVRLSAVFDGAFSRLDMRSSGRVMVGKYLRVLRLALFIMSFAHWDACLWYYMSRAEGFGKSTWAAQVGLLDETPLRQYLFSLYNALGLMLSVGVWGNVHPESTPELLFTLVSMVAGASMYAFFIGSVSSLVMNLDPSRVLYHQREDMLVAYMAHRNLPSALQRRIAAYFEFRWRGKKVFDERQLLAELSDGLRKEVLLHMCRDLVEAVPFFQGAKQGFLTSVISLLRPQSCAPGDFVIHQGETAEDMFFIGSGRLAVLRDEKTLTILSEGSYFGEMALLFGSKRSASVQALTFADLYALSRTDFDLLLREYPEMDAAMRQVAKRRLRNTHAMSAAAESKAAKQMDGKDSNVVHPSDGTRPHTPVFIGSATARAVAEMAADSPRTLTSPMSDTDTDVSPHNQTPTPGRTKIIPFGPNDELPRAGEVAGGGGAVGAEEVAVEMA